MSTWIILEKFEILINIIFNFRGMVNFLADNFLDYLVIMVDCITDTFFQINYDFYEPNSVSTNILTIKESWLYNLDNKTQIFLFFRYLSTQTSYTDKIFDFHCYFYQIILFVVFF